MSIHPICSARVVFLSTTILAGISAGCSGLQPDTVSSDQAFLSTSTFEAENLARTAWPLGSSVVCDSKASGGKYVQLGGLLLSGAYVEFTLPNLCAGTYDVTMYFVSDRNRGINQARFDGTNLGSACDEYRSGVQYGLACSLGRKTVTSGNHKLRFNVTGKNPSSFGYMMAIDKIVLTPASAVGTGGATGKGGGLGTGGFIGTGGAMGTGGFIGTGGAMGTGGFIGTGGAMGTGGFIGTGGAMGTGGFIGTGGAMGTGGFIGTGGAMGTGGFIGTGGAMGTGGGVH